MFWLSSFWFCFFTLKYQGLVFIVWFLYFGFEFLIFLVFSFEFLYAFKLSFYLGFAYPDSQTNYMLYIHYSILYRHVHLTDWDWDSIPGGNGLYCLLLFPESMTMIPDVQWKYIFKAILLLAFGTDIQPFNPSRVKPKPNLDLNNENV